MFPDPSQADAHGLVATTPDMDSDLLLEAYRHGIFPWSESPVRWFSPDPRAIFLAHTLHVPRRVGKWVRRYGYRVTVDRAFGEVVEACRAHHAAAGAWIGPSFVRAYSELHGRGHAHSVEVWQGRQLVGGLYGVHIGAMFAGESMFYAQPNASKVAFAALVDVLARINTLFIDAQVLNAHTASLGAVAVRRSDFLKLLARALAVTSPWPPSVHQETNPQA